MFFKLKYFSLRRYRLNAWSLKNYIYVLKNKHTLGILVCQTLTFNFRRRFTPVRNEFFWMAAVCRKESIIRNQLPIIRIILNETIQFGLNSFIRSANSSKIRRSAKLDNRFLFINRNIDIA